MLVYKFGAIRPTEGAKLVAQQLRTGHNYYNLLTQCSRGHRAALRDFMWRIIDLKVVEACRSAQDALDRARQTVKDRRASERRRSESDDQIQTVKEALAHQKEMLQLFKAEQKKAWAALENVRDIMKERWNALKRGAHAIMADESLNGNDPSQSLFGLRHGAYTEIENAVEQASADTPFWDEALEPNDPKFRRWCGEGVVGHQIAGGMPVSALYGNDPNVRLKVLDDRFAHKHIDEKGERGGGKTRSSVYAVLSIRVGSTGKRNLEPVFASWPVRIHRPFPEKTIIKRVHVYRRFEGPRECWSAQFCLDVPKGPSAHGKGTVAFDIGWRELDDGSIRVCAWHDDHGENGVLALDAQMVAGLRKPSDIRAIRDKNLDRLKAHLCDCLSKRTLPEWLLARTVRHRKALPSQAQALAYLAKWKSPAKFRRLERYWRDNRWEGDKQAYTMLSGWAIRDLHLWSYEEGQRKGAIRHRKQFYRIFAKNCAARWESAILEDFKITRVVRRPKVEEDAQNKRASSNRQLASVHELRDFIEFAFARVSGSSRRLNPTNTTRECPFVDCQHVEAWDAAKQIAKKPPCSRCGRTWDQDDAAAIVLLRRWDIHLRAVARALERGLAAPEIVLARKKKKRNKDAIEGESRRERTIRLRAEKVKRMETARKDGSDPWLSLVF